MIQKETILVTGGVGYIGSHTVVELQKSGKNVVIVDDLSNSDSRILAQIEKITGKKPTFYQVDVKDFHALDQVFSKYSFDGIIHFAASKAVGESVLKPLLYYKNNILGLINLLELATKYNVKAFIFSSSCTVYGTPEILPVTESAPVQHAISPYGNTKQIGEEIIYDTISVRESMVGISLRYFNPIGAHESANIGELPQGIPNNLLPYLLKVVGGDLKELSVYGNDYDTPDGTCIRDYIHVVDLAIGHLNALDRILKNENKKQYEVYNLGTGNGYSVLDIINTFEEVNGIKVPYKIAPRRSGDIEQIYADPAKANSELKWKAERDLRIMLKSAWSWQQNSLI